MASRTRTATVAALALLAAAVLAIGATRTAGGGERGSAAGTCAPPYSDSSPWNTPLVSPRYDSALTAQIATIRDPLTSDPTQYTYPVYEVSAATERQPVQVDGVYSDVVGGGRTLTLRSATAVPIPLPPDAKPADGSDAQIVVRDLATGDEWGGWRFARGGDGTWRVTNAYHYNTTWSGVPPRSATSDPFGSRGAGVPYLAGLVRPCEIAQGEIRHALAFAYPWPASSHVYPATKSDGRGSDAEVPEGTRLQLDPALTESDIRGWGCKDACLTIARALQRYGMYVIDNGGRPKVMVEYEETAHWGGTVKASTPSPIPMSSFRVVLDDAPDVRTVESGGTHGRAVRLRYAVFDRGDATRETVTVERAGKRIWTLKRELHVSPSRAPTSVAWKPRRPLEKLTFCVQAWDGAGHASRRSCSALGVR